VIVTSDEDFTRNTTKILKRDKAWNKLRVCRPNEVMKTLRNMKFKI